MFWNVALISSRESDAVLSGTLAAIATASSKRKTTVDVVVNGRARQEIDTDTILEKVDNARRRRLTVRLWHLVPADKANAVNHFLHSIADPDGTVFFVDGYCRPNPDAMELLDTALESDPKALGAAAVPADGRNARAARAHMLEAGGIHGNLFAMRQQTVQRVRDRNIRLPAGFYFTDALMGTWMAFDLLPGDGRWEPQRVSVVGDASWSVWRPRFGPQRLADIVNRKRRKAQGRLESKAIHELHGRRSIEFEQSPATVEKFVGVWLDGLSDSGADLLRRDPLAAFAWRRILRRDYDAIVDSRPELLTEAVFGPASHG